MYGMLKSENIVDTNGTTHCKLKQGSKIVFHFKYSTSIEFTKSLCTVHSLRNKELRFLLNSRRKEPLMIISLFVFYIILIVQYVAWRR